MQFSNIPPPPPGAGSQRLPEDKTPGKDKLPLRRGEVVLTDYTRAQLLKLGWKEGDPIPGDMGQMIKMQQQEFVNEQTRAHQRMATKGQEIKKAMKTTKFADISELPPEKQAELSKYLQQYKEEVLRQEDDDRRMTAAVDSPEIRKLAQSGAGEEVVNAARAANVAAMRSRQQSQKNVEVVDDRPITPPIAVPAGKTFGGVIGDNPAPNFAKMQEDYDRVRAGETSQPPTAQPPPDPDKPPDTGVSSPETHCLRCGHEHGKSVDPVPTDEEKRVFLAMFLGVSRFRKIFPIVGGMVKIYFRSLTVAENSAIDYQLGVHVRRREIVGDVDYLSMLEGYRFVLSIEKIEAGGQPGREVPAYEELAKKVQLIPSPSFPPELQDGPLPTIKAWFEANVIQQEPMRRIVGVIYRDFRKLVDVLEVGSLDPNFYNGIAPPGSWFGQPPKA